MSTANIVRLGSRPDPVQHKVITAHLCGTWGRRHAPLSNGESLCLAAGQGPPHHG